MGRGRLSQAHIGLEITVRCLPRDWAIIRGVYSQPATSTGLGVNDRFCGIRVECDCAKEAGTPPSENALK